MAISDALRARIREQANNRCGYCLAQQRYTPFTLEIEHIIPVSIGGEDTEDNLWLACRTCNVYKSNQIEALDSVTNQMIPLFNPRTQIWREHFMWVEKGTLIQGISPIGRATVKALQMNNMVAITVRQNWVQVGWHPPKD